MAPGLSFSAHCGRGMVELVAAVKLNSLKKTNKNRAKHTALVTFEWRRALCM